MEIPEYLYTVFFAVIISFIVYALEPPQINIISSPMSNFTNINKTILYTVEEPDQYTKSLYKYGGLTNAAKAIGISREDFVKHLAHQGNFILNCTGFQEEHFGDPVNKSLYCDIMGEKIWVTLG